MREIRLEAGLSGRDLGRLAGWHSSKISKIEYARQAPTPADIRIWCEHCAADDVALELVVSLHNIDSLFVEWRRMERAGFKHLAETLNVVWDQARHYRIYSGLLVPGPVQTADYVRALLGSIRSRRNVIDDVEDAVQLRMLRQQSIHHRDRRFAIVVEESALRHRFGGVETMAGQLGYLLTVGTIPGVSLGVIPLDADRTLVWPTEPFHLFDNDHVAVETLTGMLTIRQSWEVAAYAQAFAGLAKLAVYGAKARALIAQSITALDALP